jgi:ABC-type nickel/cobalt efflux system permease component RcnA
MGFAGGMVPSPSAVIVLLGALTLGRAWFGVTLVLAYGLGLALTLVVAGLVLVRAQAWLEPRLQRRAKLVRVAALLPAVTAVAVFSGGLLLAARAAAALV